MIKKSKNGRHCCERGNGRNICDYRPRVVCVLCDPHYHFGTELVFLFFRWRFNIMAVASTARGAVTFVIKSAPSCPRWIGCVYNCGACVTKIHQLSVYTLLLWLNINSCARLPWPFWYQLFSAPVVISPLLRAAWPKKRKLALWESARCGLYHYRPCCSLFMIPNPSLAAVISSSLCIDHMAARSRAIDFIQAVAPECQGSSPVRLCAPLESHIKNAT